MSQAERSAVPRVRDADELAGHSGVSSAYRIAARFTKSRVTMTKQSVQFRLDTEVDGRQLSIITATLKGLVKGLGGKLEVEQYDQPEELDRKPEAASETPSEQATTSYVSFPAEIRCNFAGTFGEAANLRQQIVNLLSGRPGVVELRHSSDVPAPQSATQASGHSC